MIRLYNPNVYFYDKHGGISYDGNNQSCADFGARNKLPCGGAWIIGDTFAFCIEYAADNYLSAFTRIREFNNKMQMWNELRRHLCSVERNMHTAKTYNDVAKDIGLVLTNKIKQ